MIIEHNISDHVFAKYLRDHNVNWDKTENKVNANIFWNSNGQIIAIDIYNDRGSERKFTILLV